MEGMQHHTDALDCNGNLMNHHGIHGGWFGHIAPGAVFMLWGVWHMFNIITQYVALQRRNDTHLFQSKASYRVFNVPIESVLKFLVPLVGVSIELHIYSREHYRALMCPKGTLHAGEWFNADNINNWQHTSVYPAFVLSGIVDLVATRVPLPRGLDSLFVALGFINEAIIMGSHTKHIPLDQLVHQLLYATSAVAAVLWLLEAVFTDSFLVSTGKSVFMVVQGTWLCAIARLMFESHTQWSYEYMASYDLTPVLYCYHLMGVLAFFFMLYVAVYLISNGRDSGGFNSRYEHVKQSESDSEQGVEIVNVVPHRA